MKDFICKHLKTDFESPSAPFVFTHICVKASTSRNLTSMFELFTLKHLFLFAWLFFLRLWRLFCARNLLQELKGLVLLQSVKRSSSEDEER